MDFAAANRDLLTFNAHLKESRSFVHQMQEDMVKFAEHVDKSTKGAGTMGKFFKDHLAMVKSIRSERANTAKEALSFLRREQEMLQKRLQMLEVALVGEEDVRKIASIDRTMTHLERQMMANHRQMQQVATESSKIANAWGLLVGGGTAAGSLLTRAVGVAGQFNRAIIQANSDLVTRNRLMRDALAVSVATGAEMDEVGKIFEALVSEGFELRGSLRETAEIAVKLNKGLGMSVAATVRLAASAASTRNNYAEIAESVARIANLTSTTADEAERYATAVAKAAVGAGGARATVPLGQLTETISMVTGALKGTLADPNELAALIPRLTRFQDLGGLGAGMLGTGGTQFLSGPNAQGNLQRVLANLAKLPQQFGETSPALELLADQLGVSRTTLQELSEAYRQQGDQLFKLNPQVKAQNDLQRRYQEQMRASNEVLGMFQNQLMALAVNALQPAVGWLRTMAGWLQKMNAGFQATNKALSGIPANIISGAAVVLFAGAVGRLTLMLFGAQKAVTGLTARILGLDAASAASGKGALGRQIGTSILELFTTRWSWKGLASSLGGTLAAWLPRLGMLFLRFLGPIGLIAAPLLLLNAYFKREEARMNQRRLQDQPTTSKQQEIAAFTRKVAELMARPGMPSGTPGRHEMADFHRRREEFLAPVHAAFEEFQQKLVRRGFGANDIKQITESVQQQVQAAISVEARKTAIASSIDTKLAAEGLRRQEEIAANGVLLNEYIEALNGMIKESIKLRVQENQREQQTQQTDRVQSVFPLTPFRNAGMNPAFQR